MFQGTLQQFVDNFFRSVLCSGAVVPPAVKYFFDFLDEQALKHDNVDEETIHIWKTNRCASLSLSLFSSFSLSLYSFPLLPSSTFAVPASGAKQPAKCCQSTFKMKQVMRKKNETKQKHFYSFVFLMTAAQGLWVHKLAQS